MEGRISAYNRALATHEGDRPTPTPTPHRAHCSGGLHTAPGHGGSQQDYFLMPRVLAGNRGPTRAPTANPFSKFENIAPCNASSKRHFLVP